jgi:hypothetical protein
MVNTVTMHVMVHLDPEVAKEIRDGIPQSPKASELMNITKSLGVNLQPLHPSSPDPGLGSTFFVEAKDAGHATEIVSQLQAAGARAYMKPSAEMP